MGKRPHPDADSSGHGPEDGMRKRPRMNRPHKHKQKPQAAETDSMSAIKKRARAIERLLARDNLKLPANKKNDLERELAAHKQRIEDARVKKERSRMIAKYHMVRFFERKKAERFAKQLSKKVAQATDPEEAAQLKADLHVAQVDIDYARYFPFMEPYISLYAAAAASEKPGDNIAAHYLRTPRPPMWIVIEKTREEGQAALERLQNRRPEKGLSSGDDRKTKKPDGTSKHPSGKKAKGETQSKGKPAKGKPNKVEEDKRREDGDEDSDDSDGGGFFEED